MLKEVNRLKHKTDFELLHSVGQFLGGPLINAQMWKIHPEEFPRRNYHADDLKIAFVAGLKVSKKAVIRNRAKRQMREAVRLLLKEERIKGGFLISFIAKPNIIGASYDEIQKNIIRLLEKAGILL